MTIFGVSWSELRAENVATFLADADDEGLLWEAKGTELDKNEVRRQVCGFANSHEGGYLILGASRARPGQPDRRWKLNGVPFPDEPALWIAGVVADPDRGVRPRPDFDVVAWPAEAGHVAVVRVTPTLTPPCIANGTVYERLPGKTQPVRDPLRLASLFSRGDEARRDAQARADRAARVVMEEWLEAEAGVFARPWTPVVSEQPPDPEEEEAAYLRFSVGVAAVGNTPDIAGRLFRHEFSEEIWEQLRDRPMGLPSGFGNAPDPVYWSQDALTWRHEAVGIVDTITIVRAAWDASVATGQKLATEDAYPDSLAQNRVAPQWRLADELVQRLGGFGDVYVTLIVGGGRFPRRRDPGSIVMRRGPLSPGVSDDFVASFGRELMRAVGNPEPEP